MRRSRTSRAARRLLASAGACAWTWIIALGPVWGREIVLPTKSGLPMWVDPATPNDRQTYVSSRGQTWELVMSDEFDTPGRSFRPGDDHIWTSLEKPDGVNAALEVYSHNMTTTNCDNDDDGDKVCYFEIEVREDPSTIHVWNQYQAVPGYKDVTFHYRAAMVQSWNKFCFQGGMLEVRAQLPGAVGPATGNPDVAKGRDDALAATGAYYPTWPGIWMMGNLGRAIFSASTNRMWPFTYNECRPDVFEPSNQRISACDSDPGHGLNPNQGRGAPEIDLLEGGGTHISSSVQIGPGMPIEYRVMIPKNESVNCVYGAHCQTPGANVPDVPTAVFRKTRKYQSWYQGLRYAANNFCQPSADRRQNYATIKAVRDSPEGITDNQCSLETCPGSLDPHADMELIDGKGPNRWGVNSNGTCFPLMNGYYGSFLCSPGQKGPFCANGDLPSDGMPPFAYQMDAISSNWPVHVAAYTKYLVYQLEWVTGRDGYIRWMLEGHPLFEIPARAIESPPQNAKQSNPRKLMIEEPMYLILNVAVSQSWGASPPNAGGPCRGDGDNDEHNRICDAFPMKMKIDYIRLYQDVTKGSKMTLTCDPPTHPTRQWILDHHLEYRDDDNPIIEVRGGAFCRTNDDCTVGNSTFGIARTGTCSKNRCACLGATWTGPRCTMTRDELSHDSDKKSLLEGAFTGSFGPPFMAALAVAGATVVITAIAVCLSTRETRRTTEKFLAEQAVRAKALQSPLGGSQVAMAMPSGDPYYQHPQQHQYQQQRQQQPPHRRPQQQPQVYQQQYQQQQQRYQQQQQQQHQQQQAHGSRRRRDGTYQYSTNFV